MIQKLESSHNVGNENIPLGGTTKSIGLAITWQRGPVDPKSNIPNGNGALPSTVVAAVIGRLEFLQTTKGACVANDTAIKSLKDALTTLDTAPAVAPAPAAKPK